MILKKKQFLIYKNSYELLEAHDKLFMAWIDYLKAYDMIPHSWILKSKNIVTIIRKSVTSWKSVLTSRWRVFAADLLYS